MANPITEEMENAEFDKAIHVVDTKREELMEMLDPIYKSGQLMGRRLGYEEGFKEGNKAFGGPVKSGLYLAAVFFGSLIGLFSAFYLLVPVLFVK